MALTNSDVTYPTGDLQPSMFPDGDLSTSATAWIADAVLQTTDEDAQKHWVYYRAYTAISNRIAATPSQENSFSNHTVSWGADRVKAFNDLAGKHLAEYSRISGNDVMSSTRPASLVVH